MPNQLASDTITRLTVAQTIDTGRLAGDPFKLPAGLRTDLDNDLTELSAREVDVAPKEGLRAGASAARRAALAELVRQHRGGYRGIAALDESALTEGERLQVFEAYGWESGEIGDFDDSRAIGMARLAPTVTAAEVGGVAGRLYAAARITRIAAQLAIIDALESTAGGADRELATLRRDAALDLAGTTLLRVRFLYCAATRDADQTPELVRIGFQPRRAPGTVDDGEPAGSSSSSSSSSSSGPVEAPENVVATPGAAGSGELSFSADPVAGATSYILREGGPGDEPTVLETSATLPIVHVFTPGAEVTVTLWAVGPGGNSGPSAFLTATAP